MSFYGYAHCRMTTEISVMYGDEKVKEGLSERSCFGALKAKDAICACQTKIFVV